MCSLSHFNWRHWLAMSPFVSGNLTWWFANLHFWTNDTVFTWKCPSTWSWIKSHQPPSVHRIYGCSLVHPPKLLYFIGFDPTPHDIYLGQVDPRVTTWPSPPQSNQLWWHPDGIKVGNGATDPAHHTCQQVELKHVKIKRIPWIPMISCNINVISQWFLQRRCPFLRGSPFFFSLLLLYQPGAKFSPGDHSGNGGGSCYNTHGKTIPSVIYI